MFCLVATYHLEKAELDKNEYPRFEGKVIKFEINMDENLVFDVSEEDELNVISGIYRGVSDFKKTSSGTINYSTKEELRGDQGRIVKYKYNNSIFINNDKRSGLLTSRIDQTGLSLKKFNFSIPCRWYDYDENEKNVASRGNFLKNKKKEEALKKGKVLVEQFIEDQKKAEEERKKNQAGQPKIESKITVNENEILNMEAYVPFSPNALLTMSKAKFFNNDFRNYVFLKNRNYLKFKKGQKLSFEDVKELSERHFFGLPLQEKVDVERLKEIKKEYFEKKKTLKLSS
jgi:hypothetical protein